MSERPAPAKLELLVRREDESFEVREVGSALGCTSANVAYHVRQIRRQWEEWERG